MLGSCFLTAPKSRLLPVLLAAIALAMFAEAVPAAAAPAFPLHTSGRFIVDANGNRVRLNAFNWYGAESTDYVVEGLQAQSLPNIVTTIKGMGFNAVRLLWSNQMVEKNPVVGNYALAANASLQGENALTIFDTVVNALANAGVMVILDNHMSDAGWCCSTTDGNMLWYNANYPQANWIADWQALAQRYQNNPWVIGADLRNEPRGTAKWGGSDASVDWHAAAQTGGNAVLAINPGLLIFVEGVSYAGDLSGVASLPVQLNVPNQIVYEAHDYGFWYSGFTNYSAYVNKITPKWGYLVTGSNPQPLWVGEFGTCNNAATCVASTTGTDLGYWFNAMTSYVRDYGIDWSYWAINGTTESGNGGGFGSVEGYGVLNTSWNGSALSSLTSRLQAVMDSGTPAVSTVPAAGSLTVSAGGTTTATVTLVPANGFTGAVNLSCSISGPSGGNYPPQCNIPASVTIAGNSSVDAAATITTTAARAQNVPAGVRGGRAFGAFGGVAMAGLMVLFGKRSRWRSLFLSVFLMMGIGFGVSGCGGGGSSSGSGGNSTPGTTSGSYSVTISASGAGVNSVSTQIALTVQ